MKRVKNHRKNIVNFNKTSSGASKFALFVMGIILGIVSSYLFGYMCGNYNTTGNYRYYDWLIFVAIFLLIFTGELIGIYFGAYEQYRLNKKQNEEGQLKIVSENISEENKIKDKSLKNVKEKKERKKVEGANKKTNKSSKSENTMVKKNISTKEKKIKRNEKNI